MPITKENRIYHSNVSYWIDREDFLHCVVTFNFIQFLSDRSSHPQIYDNAAFQKHINALLEFKFYLEDGEIFEEFDEVRELNLAQSEKLKTFLAIKKVNKIKGSFEFKGSIRFQDGFYKFVEQKVLENIETSEFGLDDYNDKILMIELKNIMDKKYQSTFSPSTTDMFYEFYHPNIKIPENKLQVSFLRKLASNTIDLETYLTFIAERESDMNSQYSSNLPIFSWEENRAGPKRLSYDLEEKTGQLENYLTLSMKILRNENYIDSDYLNGISVLPDAKRLRNVTQNSFGKIEGIQSDSCENELFSSTMPTDLKDSDLLYISYFLNNFDKIDINDYWIKFPLLLPVYLLEIISKYNVYYRSNIEEGSLYESWELLETKSVGDLPSGKYLCKICPNLMYLQDYIIENYFILEK